MDITVIICTYNPRRDYLERTLESLRAQSLPREQWELLLIDNHSAPPLAGGWDLSWHPSARIIREERPGLTHARHRGFAEAAAPLIVFSDDDNILDPDYLAEALRIAQADEGLGIFGGKSLPEYDEPPPDWFSPELVSLGCRDLGDEAQAVRPEEWNARRDGYPPCAPIGAGMVIRREAFATYVRETAGDPRRLAFGRTGASLVSGEDNDMVLTLLKNGWSIGYFPALSLKHLMPPKRINADYLARLGEASMKSWIEVLSLHGIQQWKPVAPVTVPLRKWRAFLMLRAWKGPREKIRWRTACGAFAGRASLSTQSPPAQS